MVGVSMGVLLRCAATLACADGFASSMNGSKAAAGGDDAATGSRFSTAAVCFGGVSKKASSLGIEVGNFGLTLAVGAG